jgi:hypothetical protein
MAQRHEQRGRGLAMNVSSIQVRCHIRLTERAGPRGVRQGRRPRHTQLFCSESNYRVTRSSSGVGASERWEPPFGSAVHYLLTSCPCEQRQQRPRRRGRPGPSNPVPGRSGSGAAEAMPQVETNAMTVAAKDWLRDFMGSTPLTLVTCRFTHWSANRDRYSAESNANSCYETALRALVSIFYNSTGQARFCNRVSKLGVRNLLARLFSALGRHRQTRTNRTVDGCKVRRQMRRYRPDPVRATFRF